MEGNLPRNSRHSSVLGNMMGGFLSSLFRSCIIRIVRGSTLLQQSRSLGSKGNGFMNLASRISWERRSQKCVRDRHHGSYLENLDVVRITFIGTVRGSTSGASGSSLGLRNKFLRVRFPI